MNRKYKIALVIVAGILILWGVGRYRRLPLLGIAALEAVPKQTGLLLMLEKRTLDKFAGKEEVNPTTRIFLPSVVLQDLKDFLTLFGKKIELPPEQPLCITINPNRTSGIDLLYILDGFRKTNLEKLLRDERTLTFRQSVFRSRTIMTVQNGDRRFALAKYRNLLLVARHAYLVENAISQLKSPATSLCRDGRFARLSKKSGKGEEYLNALINFDQFGSQFSPLMQAAKIGQVEGMGDLADWMLLRLPVAKKNAGWGGTFSPDQENALLQSNFRAVPLLFKNVFKVLPDNLASFAWLILSGIPNGHATSPNREFYSEKWMGRELALATGEPMENGVPEVFLLLQTAGAGLAETQLQSYATKVGNLGSYDYQMFRVIQLMGTEVGEIAGVGQALQNPFATVLGEYVLFSNSKVGLERWLDKYIAGQTFSKNVHFLQSMRPLPEVANGFLYADSEKAWQQLVGFLDSRLEATLRGNPLKFSHLGVTWRRSGSFFEMDCIAPAAGAKTSEQRPATVLWRVPLASACRLTPFVFKDPRSAETLVFTQDAANKIYLVSRSGRVLWRRSLEESIQSRIFTTDLTNNGETQLVFSTATRIYVVEISTGNDVGGYPLELQVPATNGVTVIDFFKSHDYQFFLACENGKAYGFDERGSPVEGWRPHEGVGIVRHPILHFQEGGRDFLVLLNEEGTLQVYRKNGELRFPEKKFGAFFRQAPDFQAIGNGARIVACDTTGKVYVTNLEGTDFRLSLSSGNTGKVHFVFANVAGDERKDYLALSGRNLSVSGYEGNSFVRLWGHVFHNPQDEIFALDWGRSRTKYIGALSRDKKQILMMDGSGRLLPQFPLAGDTPFVVADVMGDKKPVVVVGLEDNLYAYSFD